MLITRLVGTQAKETTTLRMHVTALKKLEPRGHQTQTVTERVQSTYMVQSMVSVLGTSLIV